jgi:hypothetical protein
VCYVIGDVEGHEASLRDFVKFIDRKAGRQFVFLGDLFDDISDVCPERDANMNCLRLLSRFFASDDGYTGPETFRDIRFFPTGGLSSRVSFILGNAERDALHDLQGEYTAANSGRWVWEDTDSRHPGKYTKTLADEELRLLYRYFRSCRTEIVVSEPGVAVHFRHAAVTNIAKAEQFVAPDAQNFVVCGHNKHVGVGAWNGPADNVLMVDPSLSPDDTRMAKITVQAGAIVTKIFHAAPPRLKRDSLPFGGLA